jgi:hypothetical protein
VLPRHWVRRGALFPSTQLRRPRSHPSLRLPQLGRPHRHGEERRRPRTSVSPVWFSPSDLDRTARTVGYRFARAPYALTHLTTPPAAAHPSQSDFPRPILIERLGPPSVRSWSNGSDPPRTPVAVRFPSSAGPARSVRFPHLSLTLPVPLVSARPPARPPARLRSQI